MIFDFGRTLDGRMQNTFANAIEAERNPALRVLGVGARCEFCGRSMRRVGPKYWICESISHQPIEVVWDEMTIHPEEETERSTTMGVGIEHEHSEDIPVNVNPVREMSVDELVDRSLRDLELAVQKATRDREFSEASLLLHLRENYCETLQNMISSFSRDREEAMREEELKKVATALVNNYFWLSCPKPVTEKATDEEMIRYRKREEDLMTRLRNALIL